MALFGIFKKPGHRSLRPLKKGQRIEFKPTVVYNPAKTTKPQLKKTNRKPGINWKLALASLAALILVAGVVYGVVQLLHSEELKVKNFTLLGNRTINDTQVDSALQSFSGKSILLVDANKVEQKLLNDFNIFNGVEVEKYFPDTLFVKISEREPKLVYIDLSGAFLLDGNGQILQQVFLDPVVIPDEKINIARGLGDPQSDYLKGLYLQDFLVQQKLVDKTPLEQQAAIAQSFNFPAIPLNDRLKKLADLQKQYYSEFNNYWDKENQAVDISDYSSYPRIDALDAQVWKPGDKIDMSRMPLTSDLMNLFSARKIVLTRVIWEGELLVRIVTIDNKELVFGTERDVTQQFEDYLLVVDELEREGHNYCQIDVSASKIAVRQCK